MQSWLKIWEALLAADRIPTLVALGLILAMTAIEWLAPAEPGHGLAGRARNFFFMIIFKFFGLCAIAAWFAFGPALAVPRLAPTGLTLGLFVVGHLFVTDFLYYWYHRAQHRFEPLWAVHELHHADTELNATTSFRTYWLEAPIQTILVATPTIMLFGERGLSVAIGVAAIGQFFLIFSHCNFRLWLGPLTSVICGPQLHRLHHSRLPIHRDKNFAQIFPVIDRVFGTYHAPAQDEYPPTGAEGLAGDAPLARALSQPFLIWAGYFGFKPEEKSRR